MALLLLLAACSAQTQPPRAAAAVHADDTCAVCGMYLDHSPGPRGQAWVQGRPRPVIFDSVRDFFAWVLQPEHAGNIEAAFVQDASRIDWARPVGDPGTFIDARRAYYVAWQPRPGSMGPTLAPFARRSSAERFVRTWGGAVLDFDQITPELIANLAPQCPAAQVRVGGNTLVACHASTAPDADARSPGDPVPIIPAVQYAAPPTTGGHHHART